MILEGLSLALIIEVKVRRSGGRYEAAYRLIDRRGVPSTVDVTRADSARDLSLNLVRDIYKATGVISFSSEPSGARVLIDGAQIGVTPLEYRVPIGRHSWSIQLAEHAPIEGESVVSSTQAVEVSEQLALLQGVLVLENTPPGAVLIVEGEPDQQRDASAPLELAPGTYGIEVRAEGYESRQERVEIEPGITTRRPAALIRLGPLLRDISADAISYNRYIARFSYDHSFQTTTFRGARASTDDGEFAFTRFLTESGNVEQDVDSKRFFDTSGVRLDLAYALENFGITALTLAYLTDSREYDAQIEDLEAEPTSSDRFVNVRLLKLTRLQVRPLNLFYRFFYKNVVPSIELGVGMNFQWIDVREQGADELDVFTMSQTEGFWTAEIGVNYFFTPNFSALVRYSLHDHFNVGVGMEHAISIGVGGAFPNLFGFEPEPPEKL